MSLCTLHIQILIICSMYSYCLHLFLLPILRNIYFQVFLCPYYFVLLNFSKVWIFVLGNDLSTFHYMYTTCTVTNKVSWKCTVVWDRQTDSNRHNSYSIGIIFALFYLENIIFFSSTFRWDQHVELKYGFIYWNKEYKSIQHKDKTLTDTHSALYWTWL